MTLPSLVGRYQEKVTVNKLKQTYSILSQAFEQAVFVEGPVETWCDISSGGDTYDTCSSKMTDIIGKYVKKLRDCGERTFHLNSACFAQKYLNRIDSSITPWSPRLKYSFVMTNGAAVLVEAGKGAWCTASLANSSEYNRYIGHCAEIQVDVNSVGRPNVSDRDLFTFKMYKDGITPLGKKNDTIWVDSFNALCIANKNKVNYPGRCAAWVIVNENLDYLHCSDLSWSGKTKCSK